MQKTLWLDCSSGVSGDMVVGALLDLGASEEGLRRALASLPVGGFEVRIGRKTVRSLDACDFDVVLGEEHDCHDHDMAYLFGEKDASAGAPTHAPVPHHAEAAHDGGDRHHDLDYDFGLGLQGPGAPADHDGHDHHGREETFRLDIDHDLDRHHDHDHDRARHHAHGLGRPHRTLADVTAAIEAADLTPAARDLAIKIFTIVASAEARAHGVPVEEVHFHEVGAIDSIVDVVSAAFCLDDLGVDDVFVSALGEGDGTVRSAHGVLPIPVPAVTHIVEEAGLTLAPLCRRGEFVTPTGAAIAAAFRTKDELPAAYRILGCGIGSGKRAYDPPSLVRALLIEGSVSPTMEPASPASPMAGASVAADADDADRAIPYPIRRTGKAPSEPAFALGAPDLWKLECEVDDCTGEALGRLLGRLYDAGVREAHFLPVYMKKNRPGYQVEVLCDEATIPMVERVVFEDTTTIGIRRSPLWRTALERRAEVVQTPFGMVGVKVATLPTGTSRAIPEHDSVARVADASGVPYQEVYRAAVSAAGEL